MEGQIASEPFGGTRFKLFAQPPFLPAFRRPEIVAVSSRAGTVGPGPSDSRMYVIDPIGKQMAYGPGEDRFGGPVYLLPPWPGEVYPPAMPDESGHFDYLEPEDPEFESAHFFGVVRFTLDIWEKYLGHPVVWHFARDFDRLELVIQRNLRENAFMGYGFLEVGVHHAADGAVEPFSLNFDVIAHEVGHCIVYSVVGVPDPGTEEAEYYGFHESAADLSALVCALHFDSVLDHLLSSTRGNLYALNYVNRIAELSNQEQIRVAANDATLMDFAFGWHDEHDLAQPLTGAMFDILVDIFHEELVARGLFCAHAEDLSDRLEDDPGYHAEMQPVFDEAFLAEPEGFRAALEFARDMLGTMLAETWRRLSPDNLAYDGVGRTLLFVDGLLTGGRYGRIIRVNFDRRDIGRVQVGPRLSPPSSKSHFDLSRVFTPGLYGSCCQGRRPSFRERYETSMRGF